MLRLVKWFSYRDGVLEHLGTLLVMYPRRRQFGDDFPGLRAVMRGHFEAGVSPTASAVQLTALIIGELIGQLTQAEREAVLEQLQSLDIDAFEPIAARQISRRPEAPRDRAAFAVRLIGGALLMARRMAAEGTLGRGEQAALLAKLDEALCPATNGAADARPFRSLSERFATEEPPTRWRQADPGRREPARPAKS